MNQSIIFEHQSTAPAPCQTYFQVVIERDKVILRDWPKLRHSQAVAKHIVHPGQDWVPVLDYHNSNLRDTVKQIFGEQIDTKLMDIINEMI